jgi:hypothetical protein
MAERYGALVESMYASDEERRIAAEVAALTPGESRGGRSLPLPEED